jgi:hypothetical protein
VLDETDKEKIKESSNEEGEKERVRRPERRGEEE